MEQTSVLLPSYIDAVHLASGQEPGVIPYFLSNRPGENTGGAAQVAGACRLDTVEVYQSLPAEFHKYFKGEPINAAGAIIRIYSIGAKYHVQCCICSGLWSPNSKTKLDKEGRRQVLGISSW